MDAVAREANVSRMTVYYQYESKTKLLEALCDDLAARGGMEQLAKAFASPDALAALEAFVRRFAQFWGADRRLVRRLHGMAALDPEIEEVIRAREARRREGLKVLVRRVKEQYGRPRPKEFDGTVEMLWAVISFEMFNALAGSDKSFADVVPQIMLLAKGALALK
jgi:AcrR family transcriptional regulator